VHLWLQNSRVIIITAGARQKEGETRLDLVQNNVGIFKSIVPELVKYSPEAVIVVVTNPCDIMAWVTWKLSGLPKHRVIASGTMLDTSRFRHLLAERFNVAAHNVHGFVIIICQQQLRQRVIVSDIYSSDQSRMPVSFQNRITPFLWICLQCNDELTLYIKLQ